MRHAAGASENAGTLPPQLLRPVTTAGGGGGSEAKKFEAYPPKLPRSRTMSQSPHNGQAGRKRPMQVIAPYFYSLSRAGPHNTFVTQRDGQVLGSRMIIKYDDYPASLSAELDMHISGAPNFRRSERFEVYGVAQPAVYGIRTILNMMNANVREQPNSPVNRSTSPVAFSPTRSPVEREASVGGGFGGGRSVLTVWINLREEPVIYLNQRPFVLRELDHPLRNMVDFRGIDAKRLNDVERRLKNDVVAEAGKHRGNVMVHDEALRGVVRSCWECVNKAAVQTTAEVFHSLSKEFDVELHRVPITGDSAPQAKTFDELSHIYTKAVAASQGQQMCFVINCQRGSGRSTMGMIIMCLLEEALFDRLHHDRPISHFPRLQSVSDEEEVEQGAGSGEGLGLRSAATSSSVVAAAAVDGRSESAPSGSAESLPGLAAFAPTAADAAAAAAARGSDSEIITRLVRLLNHGAFAKRKVDEAIDQCGRVQNLKQAILQSADRSENTRAADRHGAFSRQTAELLKRYFYLVCFRAFLQVVPISYGVLKYKFSEWLEKRPEILRLMELTNDPDQLTPLALPDVSDPFVKHVVERRGTVLGKRTIIKTEFFRYRDQLSKQLWLEGRPNFRHLRLLPVSAVAQPTMEGVRNILDTVGGKRVVWINLREEPVVYIKGRPHVLRDLVHPFRSLVEFTTGMTSERSQKLEERLKADILSELAANHERKILVHEEGLNRSLDPRWVSVDSASEDILTTAEAHEWVSAERHFTYYRVPLIVGETPDLQNLDQLCHILQSELREGTEVVFNCQLGARRSTMGMVVACLVLWHRARAAAEKRGEALAAAFSPQAISASLRASPTNQAPSPLDLARLAKPSMSSLTLTAPSPSVVAAAAAAAAAAMAAATGSSSSSSLSSPALAAAIAAAASSSGSSASPSAAPSSRLPAGVAVMPAAATAAASAFVSPAASASASSISLAKASAATAGGAALGPSGGDGKVVAPTPVHPAPSLPAAPSPMPSPPVAPTLSEAPDAAESMAGGDAMADEANGDASSPGMRAGPRRGEFKGILGLIRALKDGLLVKSEVDEAVDLCGSVFNIREIIAESMLEASQEQRSGALEQAIKYLESYACLICLNAYLHHYHRHPNEKSFYAWIHNRKELLLLLENLRKEPDGSLQIYSFDTLNSEISSIYESRSGNVLTRGTIVKMDHFIGCRDDRIPQPFFEAPNYRALDAFPVAGAAAPFDRGVRSVILDALDRASRHSLAHAVWINLREEPVVYLQGEPYCLREFDRPYVNIENTGISARRVEAQEESLKLDLLREAARFDGRLLVHDEDNDGNLRAKWLQGMSAENILTSKEMWEGVFRQMRDERGNDFGAFYARNPITDEQPPSNEAFDFIVQNLEESFRSLGSSFYVFNCQMGRGRTTTGMIIACLWCIHRLKIPVTSQPKSRRRDTVPSHEPTSKRLKQEDTASSLPPPLDIGAASLPSASTSQQPQQQPQQQQPHAEHRPSGQQQPAAASAAHRGSMLQPSSSPPLEPMQLQTEEALRRGEFKLIQSLVRVIPGGIQIKQQVDAVIDTCDHMQNLRLCIFETCARIKAALASKKQQFIRRGAKYLARYFFLICYNAYFRDEAPSGCAKRFDTWFRERPELENILVQSERDFPPAPYRGDD